MRDWWLRTLLVLQRPRPVFAALRDDSPEAAADRSEPVLLIVLLAGIATALSTPAAARLMDQGDYDAVNVAIWAFLAGSLNGLCSYYLLGALLHGGARAVGSQGSYRRARHVVAFAAVPLALSLLLVWPVKLALYGTDWFRTGGRDAGDGGLAFDLVELVFAVWSLALLLAGVRAVHSWGWGRAGAACAIALAAPVVVVLLLASLSS